MADNLKQMVLVRLAMGEEQHVLTLLSLMYQDCLIYDEAGSLLLAQHVTVMYFRVSFDAQKYYFTQQQPHLVLIMDFGIAVDGAETFFFSYVSK